MRNNRLKVGSCFCNSRAGNLMHIKFIATSHILPVLLMHSGSDTRDDIDEGGFKLAFLQSTFYRLLLKIENLKLTAPFECQKHFLHVVSHCLACLSATNKIKNIFNIFGIMRLPSLSLLLLPPHFLL